jgi:hypothetical protein
MHRKPTVDVHGRYSALSLLLVWALAACNSTGGSPPAGGSNQVDTGNANGDAGVPTGSHDSGMATGTGDANEPSDGSPGRDAVSNTDGGVVLTDGAVMGAGDGGMGTDGGVPTDGGGTEGGLRDVGSCCSMQTTPGCGNANLEVCVCEKDQSCCTTAWGLQCVLIVQQKYCQPNVRDCVCGADAGQWDQTQCCTTDWTSTCDIVATQKCNAVQGCF